MQLTGYLSNSQANALKRSLMSVSHYEQEFNLFLKYIMCQYESTTEVQSLIFTLTGFDNPS